ncbi:MAG: 50S ribosomal protein L10 [Deltaproteobacteria bacterium]|nr:50S ribosomal protein L10 [Deltaproteobacteria bacterium]
MLRREKEEVVVEIHDQVKAARLVVFTTFLGLSVEKMSRFRDSLREAGGTYRVVKNTLVKRAVHGTVFEGGDDYFQGSSAAVFANDDPVKLCKVLKQFLKEYAQIEIKGGALDGKIITSAEIEKLATLPSREVLIAKLLFVMKAPQQKFVTLLAAIPQKLVRVLDAVRMAKES